MGIFFIGLTIFGLAGLGIYILHRGRSEKVLSFKTLDEVIAKRSQEDRVKIITDGDKLAAQRDAAVEAAIGGGK